MIREDLAMVMRDVCKLVEARTAARKVESESDIDAVTWLIVMCAVRFSRHGCVESGLESRGDFHVRVRLLEHLPGRLLVTFWSCAARTLRWPIESLVMLLV